MNSEPDSFNVIHSNQSILYLNTFESEDSNLETLNNVLPDPHNTGHVTTLNLSLMLHEVELNLPIGLLWGDIFHDTKSSSGVKYTCIQVA